MADLLYKISKSEILGVLSAEESHIIYQHLEKAEERVRLKLRLKNGGNVIRDYRERYDREGFPDTMLGEEIPFGSFVISVANAYNSMVDESSNRLA